MKLKVKFVVIYMSKFKERYFSRNIKNTTRLVCKCFILNFSIRGTRKTKKASRYSLKTHNNHLLVTMSYLSLINSHFEVHSNDLNEIRY